MVIKKRRQICRQPGPTSIEKLANPLTDDKIWLGRLDQFITWRVSWLARAKRVEQLGGSVE